MVRAFDCVLVVGCAWFSNYELLSVQFSCKYCGCLLFDLLSAHGSLHVARRTRRRAAPLPLIVIAPVPLLSLVERCIAMQRF